MMRNSGGALPARHVLGNYELFEEIGRGGMGIVYRALDLSLDRIVAVKILRDDLRAHASIVTRFGREAQAAARLDHPNIVQIYTVGAADRTPYIAMEFVDALPLSAVMQREHRLEWRPALEIARQIAAALACAHESHVIHRDVKPPNILLDDHHRAYVTDFGIAKILTLDDNLTVDGTRLGTPHYMAPERCKNGEVTAASDLYSLGVLLFQMLTGRLPYEASSPVAMVQRILSGPAARVRNYVPDVPEDVERLVAWLMELDPKHRPASGHSICDAIDRLLAGRPLDANETRATGAIEHLRKDLAANTEANRQTAAIGSGRKRRPLRVAAVAIGIAAMCAGAALYWRSPHPAPPSASAADALAWFSTPGVATFSGEGENVTLAELQLQGYSILSVSPAGADGAVAVLLEQRGPAGKRVLGTVSPAANRAGICFVTGPAARMELLASVTAIGGSLFDGYGLMRAGGALSLVSLRDYAAQIPLTAQVDGGAAVSMHPAGAQWVAAVSLANGSNALMAYALEDGKINQDPVLPGGPRIAHAQFSGDGRYLAYLRNAGAGLHSLRIVPATGATSEPTPIREGRIAMAPGAFNADASAILVSEERDGAPPAIEVITLVDGLVAAEFSGAMRAAWDTHGGVILSAPDGKGAVQLWRATVDTPAIRKQLTFLDGGTDRAVLVSPDGHWASTYAANTPKPSLVFARLAQ